MKYCRQCDKFTVTQEYNIGIAILKKCAICGVCSEIEHIDEISKRNREIAEKYADYVSRLQRVKKDLEGLDVVF